MQESLLTLPAPGTLTRAPRTPVISVSTNCTGKRTRLHRGYPVWFKRGRGEIKLKKGPITVCWQDRWSSSVLLSYLLLQLCHGCAGGPSTPRRTQGPVKCIASLSTHYGNGCASLAIAGITTWISREGADVWGKHAWSHCPSIPLTGQFSLAFYRGFLVHRKFDLMADLFSYLVFVF